MDTPGLSDTKRGHLLRRHGIAALLVGALLLWGAGFAQMEDGRVPPLDRGAVVAALASDAGSSAAAEQLRTSALQASQRRPVRT